MEVESIGLELRRAGVEEPVLSYWEIETIGVFVGGWVIFVGNMYRMYKRGSTGKNSVTHHTLGTEN